MRNSTLEKIRAQIKPAEITAKQAVNLPEAAIKQLHRPDILLSSLNDINYAEFFLLVTKVDKEYCTVIPGSINGLMAGPNDIVLPKEVLGQFAFLAMDQIMSLPKSVIGIGFAILDDAAFERVEASVLNHQYGIVTSVKPYSYALPFLGENCSRRYYHRAMEEFISHIANPAAVPAAKRAFGENGICTSKKRSWLKYLGITGSAAAALLIGFVVIETILKTDDAASAPMSPFAHVSESHRRELPSRSYSDLKNRDNHLGQYYVHGYHFNGSNHTSYQEPATATGVAVTAVSTAKPVRKNFKKIISNLFFDNPRLFKYIAGIFCAIISAVVYIFNKKTKK